ncbi:RAMP superfamily CRISPR-associated protein [Tepidimonas charontis]|uniref:CRISPR type III-B/RAMP module RAMP protein Cmr1 n=1 Tax=Tepidimonas charontis TaxID=2267262 RepID=A0A554X3I7_9BURK|nr:RAMP superfamily CRISPR-associated protein [Tepidimonas charontis]TSE30402.1 hypothetical protein Tchar_02455 [Tepidimonas charontis]
MKRLSYQLRFNTPAFLGNAEQSGQWRTPPFKALLRQWWRVASGITDADKLREEEGRLFGAANDEGGGSQQSRLRLRLHSWSEGQLRGAWGNDPQVLHPEVGPHGRNVGTHLYLGYGPLTYRQGTALKPNAAIQAGECNFLHLAWPGKEKTLVELVQLLHWFGTVGGRSRNGWGSMELEPIPSDQDGGQPPSIAPLSANHTLLCRVSRPLSECLQRDWPHALGLGADGRPLIWQSATSFVTWREAMQALAKAKIGFRTVFPLGASGPFMDRHLLAYPVTNHPVRAWGNQTRLANQLRFKVAKNDHGKLVARIFHLPCALPRELAEVLGRSAPTLQKQLEIWQTVHNWLDNTVLSGFQRI